MLSLVKFIYNNSYHSSIWMVPCEALYDKRYKTPLCWFELGENFVICKYLHHPLHVIKLDDVQLRDNLARI
ncbi:hypothetical protein CR513_19886, partial [Mucuna pruriens]